MSHGLLQSGMSRALANWLIAQRKRMPRSRTISPWLLRYQSFWFERLWTMQVARPVQTAASPDFILGFWRSGTTLLHNHLHAGWEVRAPLTWECFNPASFRLRLPPAANVQAARPMDGGQISTFGPQEDEFALLLLGEPSLYRAFLDPQLFTSAKALVDAQQTHEFPRWQQFVGLLAGDHHKRTVLKTPNHIFRLPLLQQRFPDARYVWIGRSFADALRSNRNMWTAMADLHAVTEPYLTKLDGFLLVLAERYATILESVIAAANQKLAWIDHAELVSDPKNVAGRVADFLSLSPRDHANEMVSGDIAARPSTLTRLPNLPADWQPLIERIDTLHKAAQRRFGLA